MLAAQTTVLSDVLLQRVRAFVAFVLFGLFGFAGVFVVEGVYATTKILAIRVVVVFSEAKVPAGCRVFVSALKSQVLVFFLAGFVGMFGKFVDREILEGMEEVKFLRRLEERERAMR